MDEEQDSTQEIMDNQMQPVTIANPDEFVNNTNITAEINGKKRLSHLLVKDGEIHLPAVASCHHRHRYCTCNSPPVTPEKTVDVSLLLARYPSKKADVYLTLTGEGTYLGTVYVRLLDNSLSKHIRKLCMGTTGPSYRGTVFKGRSDYSLWTGDVREYDQSRGSEHPPPPPSLVDGGKGTVGIIHGTGLRFWMAGSNIPIRAVGNVIKGMSVLEKAWKYSAGNVIIKDVGIVLTPRVPSD